MARRAERMLERRAQVQAHTSATKQPHALLPPPAGKFPKSVCTSVNECICHGIPDSRPLREGDILNIDVTVFLQVGVMAGVGHGGGVLLWGGASEECLRGERATGCCSC